MKSIRVRFREVSREWERVMPEWLWTTCDWATRRRGAGRDGICFEEATSCISHAGLLLLECDANRDPRVMNARLYNSPSWSHCTR